jgi:hypothetical protein
MRPYRLVDETLDDEEDGYPRVMPVPASGRARSAGSAAARHEAWTPRGTATPAAPARAAAPPPSIEPGLTRTHRWMLFGFLIVCAGMVLGMVMVRVWDEASRAVAALPPEGAAVTAKPAAQPAPPPPVAAQPTEAPAPPPSGGAVTTEIRVLQPNYTVAPGDTLGIIARRHGTSVEALASINNLENRNSLAVGQKLIIP